MLRWLSSLVRWAVTTCAELPLRLLLAGADAVRDSAVCNECRARFVQSLAATVAAVLSDSRVRDALAHIIAQGVNAFLQQPNLDQHIMSMAATIRETQPNLARQQGQDFPVIVGSFLQGMLLRGNGGGNGGSGGGPSKKDLAAAVHESSSGGGKAASIDTSATAASGSSVDHSHETLPHRHGALSLPSLDPLLPPPSSATAVPPQQRTPLLMHFPKFGGSGTTHESPAVSAGSGSPNENTPVLQESAVLANASLTGAAAVGQITSKKDV